MRILICPKCKNILEKKDKSLVCSNNHCFDISKNGYVHLLLANKMNSKIPGDNKLMIQARKRFLEKNHYLALAEGLEEIIRPYLNNKSVVLDAGCGEGYYTHYLKTRIEAHYYGLDISKFGIDYASRRKDGINYVIGSSFDLPFLDSSFDLLISMFAPYSSLEFNRVLKADGHLVLVNVGKNHLRELKDILYENVYDNEAFKVVLDGFELIKSQDIEKEIEITNNQDLNDLFMMTPYYYRTSPQAKKALLNISNLKLTISFTILVYEKR